MFRRRKTFAPLRLVGIVVVMPVATFGFMQGCAVSPDATDDINSAAAFIADVVGVAPAWDEAWEAHRDDWDEQAPLDVDTAITVALANNPVMRRDVLIIAARRADFAQAHVLPNPMLSFAIGRPIDGRGGDPGIIGFVQSLTDLWRRPVRIDASQLELRAAVFRVADQALDLASRTRRAHTHVARADHAVILHRQNLDLANEALTLVRQRFEVGDATALDINSAELVVHQADLGLARARMTKEENRRKLLSILGKVHAGAHWDVVAPLNGVTLFSSPSSEADAIEIALANRLDVQAAAASASAARSRVELAELGRWPGVSAGVSYQQNFANRRAVVPTIRIEPALLDSKDAAIALAETLAQQASLDAEAVRQDAVTMVRGAYVRASWHDTLVRTQQSHVLNLAQRDATLARAAFKAGTIGTTRLIDADQAVMQARLTLNELQLQHELAIIDLHRAIGGQQPSPAEETTNE